MRFGVLCENCLAYSDVNGLNGYWFVINFRLTLRGFTCVMSDMLHHEFTILVSFVV